MKNKYTSHIIVFLFSLLFPFHGNSQVVLRVMAYNIHHGCDSNEKLQLRQMAELIKKSNSQIVGLEEVDSCCNRSGNTDQAKILGKLTGMHYAYVRHFSFDGGSYGLALLSRFPITGVVNNRLPVSTMENGDTRAFLTATLLLSNGKKILAGVAHLDYREDQSRLRQSKIILNLLKKEKWPVLLLGDLNAGPQSPTLVKLKKELTDTNRMDYLTFPSDSAREKIDYIMASRAYYLKTIQQTYYKVTYSDHLPICSIFQIRY